MSEVVEEIIGRKAVEQVDEITTKLMKAAGLVDELNQKGRSLEFNIKNSNTIEATANMMAELSTNTHELAKANIDYQATIRQTDVLLKNFGTDMEQNIRVQLAYKNELKAVKDEQKELAKSTDAYGNSTDKATDKIVELTKKEKELKVAISENEQLIKAQAKANAANAGSIDQLSAKLGQFKDIFRQLSQADRDGKVGQELLKTVQQLDPTIKAFDYSTGNFQRNVGNYAGAFQGAMSVLNKELEKTKAQLSSLDAGDAAFEDLKKKEMALESTTKNLNKTFTSSKQELREFQEAAKQLGLTLGDDSNAFTEFASAVGDSKDEISDLQARVDFNASDTKYLDGTIEGVQALAGIYGIAEGAASLLGVSQEDLQQQMVTLQSILVITNGLQQVQLVLQSDSAAMQTLLAVQTKVYAGIKAVENAIVAVSNAATEANTIEKFKNKAATIAAAAATTVSTAATSLYTFVTNGATVATRLFRAALLLTGIGAVVVLIMAAVDAMSSFSSATSKATEDTRDFTAAYDAMAKTTENANKAIDRIAKKDLSAAKARGASAKELAAIEDEALKRKMRNAQLDIDITEKTLKAAAVSSKEYTEARELNSKRQEELADMEAEFEIRKNDRITEANKKGQDEAKKAADKRKKDLEELNKEIAKIRLSFITPSEDEVRSAIEDIQRVVDGQEGKIYLDAQISVDVEKIKKQLDNVDTETSQKLLGIETAFNQGLYKNVEAYEADKLNATIEGSQKRYAVEIAGLKKTLDFLPQSAQERVDIEKKLRDLELKQLDETNKLKVDKDKDAEEKILENKKRFKELTKQLENEAFDTAIGLVNALAQSQINNLDSELRGLERKKNAEIDGINTTTLSQEEKTQRIAEANLKFSAQQDALEKKKIEIQRRAAAFEKAATIAKIIADTASAIMAQLKIGPQGIPLSVAVGITGALQLARAIAAPLPQYADGTDSAEGGWALTDERGPEGYVEPSGKAYIGSNNGPTLRYLPEGTKVIPHEELVQTSNYSMIMGRPVLPQYNENSFDMSEVVDVLQDTKKINRQMLRVMQTQKPVPSNNYNPGWDALQYYLRN